jgi:Protein of unknown function (DUF3015)
MDLLVVIHYIQKGTKMKNIKKLSLTASLIAVMLATITAALADDNNGPSASTTNPSTTKSTEQSKVPGSGPNPWADCGIGAALFTETKWAAVTSNVIWDLGTTALTSATASPQTCQGKKVVAALFIDRTYAELVEETASGQGERLTTVLNLFGCDSARHANAIQQIRGAMRRAVATPNYIDQSHFDNASNFYSIVEEAVNTSCSV